MKTEVAELEKILDQEVDAFSKLEKYILDKKDSLIKGDIEKLRDVDIEIEKLGFLTQNLETQRNEIGSKFSNENLSLKEIIDIIEEEDKSRNLSFLRKKLKKIVENVQRHNNINRKLIEHSLKLIEYSINSIANVLLPEGSAYNNLGKLNKKHGSSEIISSITRDV